MSIHCEEGVYSKQHCLWNLSLTEIKVSAMSQLTSLKTSTKDLKTRKLISLCYNKKHSFKDSLWRSAYFKQYCL